jgi:hypothetical protein
MGVVKNFAEIILNAVDTKAEDDFAANILQQCNGAYFNHKGTL